MTKYNLSINEKQAHVISLALDIFSRMESGQLERCFRMIPWKYAENLKKVEPLLDQIQGLLTGMESNSNLGISNVSEDAKIAYDIHQVIRHQFSNFNKPHKWSSEELPIINEQI